jgi:hypothetical protein
MLPLGGQHVKHLKLSICSATKENHGNLKLGWPVAGPSGCKLTSSQQSGKELKLPTNNFLAWTTQKVLFITVASL